MKQYKSGPQPHFPYCCLEETSREDKRISLPTLPSTINPSIHPTSSMSNQQYIAPTTWSFWKGLTGADVNPLNNKSKTLSILNPINKYGRTFHLAWLAFFVAFLSWFAFPPLLHGSINTDLKMTSAQISNSNIIGLLATLVVRLVVGPLCDKFGPRYVMVGLLVAGAIPTAAVPGIKGVNGLYAVRFFIGILGGTFVPCVVWTTQFFDKPIVGRANALAGGWGNAGGGVTFFVMPAVVANLMHSYGYNNARAWRLAFPACPLAILLGVALMVLLLGSDTPTGPWRTRHLHAAGRVVDTNALDRAFSGEKADVGSSSRSAGSSSPKGEKMADEAGHPDMAVGTVLDEVPKDPKLLMTAKVMLHPQTLFLALSYLCSFGSELAIEGVLSAIYIQSAKAVNKQVWGQELAGQWAAMFGLLNVVTRPLGGYIADKIYVATGGSVTAKKYYMLALNVIQGVFFIAIGFVPGLKVHSLIGLMAGLAIFMEAANGANFAMVPHIFPQNNGVVSGMVGASGNLGGIFFGLAFRFNKMNYHKAIWQIGVTILAIQLAICWIPMPKKH